MAVDHVVPLKKLLRQKRKAMGLSREGLASELERASDFCGGFDYKYIEWQEYCRTAIPKADEDKFWFMVRVLRISEDEIVEAIALGLRSVLPSLKLEM